MDADLEKTDLPRFLTDSCTDAHKKLRSVFQACVGDLLESEASSTSFAKQIRLIVETLDTNLKLLKGLKATEAKKYSKEVETLQTKFAKVMDNGKKVQIVQAEIDALEREKAYVRKKKQNYSKNKGVDLKVFNDRLALLSKNIEKLNEDYKKSQDDLRQQTKDFNEAKSYILRTFNAHSASIDLRYGDNLELYKKNLNDFIGGLKITASSKLQTKMVSPVSPISPSNRNYAQTDSTSKANSVSAFTDDDKPKRTVVLPD
jgi:hypothetical protein